MTPLLAALWTLLLVLWLGACGWTATKVEERTGSYGAGAFTFLAMFTPASVFGIVALLLAAERGCP